MMYGFSGRGQRHNTGQSRCVSSSDTAAKKESVLLATHRMVNQKAKHAKPVTSRRERQRPKGRKKERQEEMADKHNSSSMDGLLLMRRWPDTCTFMTANETQ